MEYEESIISGNIENLKRNSKLCAYLAKHGKLDLLKKVVEDGCPVDRRTCLWAVRSGHLDILKHASYWGVPWNRLTCLIAAAELGNLEIWGNICS